MTELRTPFNNLLRRCHDVCFVKCFDGIDEMRDIIVSEISDAKANGAISEEESIKAYDFLSLMLVCARKTLEEEEVIA